MAKWTPAELAALKSTGSYESFSRATGGSKSYDAWEVKRRRVVLVEPTEEMDPLDVQRAVVNNIKLARQIIRLRHSIEADDELAEVIPRILHTLQSQAQTGRVTGLSYDELRALIFGQ